MYLEGTLSNELFLAFKGWAFHFFNTLPLFFLFCCDTYQVPQENNNFLLVIYIG